MVLNVAGCQIIQNGKFLLLQRSEQKSQAGLWGIPAGKFEPGESPIQAVVREVLEETGSSLNPELVNLVTILTYDFGDESFNFHLFSFNATEPINVRINPIEHQGFAWVTLEEAYAKQDLMRGVREILEALKLA